MDGPRPIRHAFGVRHRLAHGGWPHGRDIHSEMSRHSITATNTLVVSGRLGRAISPYSCDKLRVSTKLGLAAILLLRTTSNVSFVQSDGRWARQRIAGHVTRLEVFDECC
jgi:hypothetical protein